MSRLSMATVAAALALAVAAPAGAQMSGMILCEQDAKQIREHLEANKSQWSEQQYTSAKERLDVAERQCGQDATAVTQQLTELRKDMGMQPMDPQAAQTPGAPATGTPK